MTVYNQFGLIYCSQDYDILIIIFTNYKVQVL